MAEFASNCPISRPRRLPWEIDWDLNGMGWSFDHGMFYQPQDDMVPIRKPSPRVKNP